MKDEYWAGNYNHELHEHDYVSGNAMCRNDGCWWCSEEEPCRCCLLSEIEELYTFINLRDGIIDELKQRIEYALSDHNKVSLKTRKILNGEYDG